MFPLPSIQIHQQFARIGIQTTPGHYEMHSSKADMQIETTPARLEAEAPLGELVIDSSAAWDALTGGSTIRFTNRIYSQMPNIVLQGIARRVEEGNQMAAIHLKGNPIADIAERNASEPNPIQYLGEPSYTNVKIEYHPVKPKVQITPGKVDIQVRPNKPEIEYQRGNVSIYLAQQAALEITPPQIQAIV